MDKDQPNRPLPLVHSWELIERNDGDCIGELSESGQEANNKFMRAIRSRKYRKISEEACVYDTLSQMWDKSNPYINFFQPVIHRYSSVQGHTKREQIHKKTE